jgi:hypothetical protein
LRIYTALLCWCLLLSGGCLFRCPALYPFGRSGTRNAISDHGSCGFGGWSC